MKVYISTIADCKFKGTSRSSKEGYLYFGEGSPESVKIIIIGKKDFTEKDQEAWTKLFQNSQAHIIIAGTFEKEE